MKLHKKVEDHFLNPPPGSAAARAVEFGIDLTLTLENLRLFFAGRPVANPVPHEA